MVYTLKRLELIVYGLLLLFFAASFSIPIRLSSDKYENPLDVTNVIVPINEIAISAAADIISPGNISIEFGSIGNEFRWRVTFSGGDKVSSNYTIYRDSSNITNPIQFDPGPWVDQSIDSLEIGIYNYTILVMTPNNATTGTVFVEVVLASAPIILDKSVNPIK